MNVVITAPAEDDLNALWYWIREDNPERATLFSTNSSSVSLVWIIGLIGFPSLSFPAKAREEVGPPGLPHPIPGAW